MVEVVTYHSTDEMLAAVGLLHVEHTPYFINTSRNIAFIFCGAMGKVPIIPQLQQQMKEVTYSMAEYYLKEKT
jgi:hypothetical protein